MQRLARLAFSCLLLAGCDALNDETAMHAYVEDGAVMVGLHPNAALYVFSCSSALVLEKRAGDGWIAPHDDTPPFQESYFLDDQFIPASFSLGCDVSSCVRMGAETAVAPAFEFVKSGTRPAPEGTVASGQTVDVIERSPLQGELRVLVTYSTDPQCDDSHSATLPLTVP